MYITKDYTVTNRFYTVMNDELQRSFSPMGGIYLIVAEDIR